MNRCVIPALSLLAALGVANQARAEIRVLSPTPRFGMSQRVLPRLELSRAGFAGSQHRALAALMLLSARASNTGANVSAPSWSFKTTESDGDTRSARASSFTERAVPWLVDPVAFSWASRHADKEPMKLELSRPVLEPQSVWLVRTGSPSEPSTEGVNIATRGYGMPALLRYEPEDGSTVSVSVAPGSPCTGACLKVAGTF